MIEGDAHNVRPFPWSGLTENGLFTEICEPLGICALQSADTPTREGARCFNNILFRVITDTERKELEPLARKILVRIALDTLIAIEVPKHRWIGNNARC